MELFRRAAGLSLALLLSAGAAAAQEDARVLPRGYVALRAGGEFTFFDSRLGGEEGGPLGAPFATPFPASMFPQRATEVQDSLGAFFARTGQPGESFELTPDDLFFGTLDVGLAADLRRVPISLEAGVLPRVMLRVTVPVVYQDTELTRVALAGGALGLNLRADSLAKLFGRIDPSLASIGRLRFLPMAGSRAGRALQERYARATGDTTTLPLPTGTPRSGVNELLRSIQADTLALATPEAQYRLGDVEVAAKLQLLGAPTGALSPRLTGSRVAVEAGFRFPTAAGVGQDSLTEVVTDLGHAGASAALFADLALSPRLWIGTYARYHTVLARDVERYTWNPEAPWEGLGELRTVSRDPGDRLEAVLAPRFQVTDEIALSARYAFGRVGATTYEGATDPDAGPLALAGLESVAERSAHSLGAGLGYSTLGAFTADGTDIPLEVWLTYDTAIAGSGGAPEARVVRLEGRIFVPVWGGRRVAR